MFQFAFAYASYFHFYTICMHVHHLLSKNTGCFLETAAATAVPRLKLFCHFSLLPQLARMIHHKEEEKEKDTLKASRFSHLAKAHPANKKRQKYSTKQLKAT